MTTETPLPHPAEIAALLRDGIAAARAGQREQARELLMQVVELDRHNLVGWLWLSGVVDSLDDQEVCLENALILDPDSEPVRRRLEQVRAQNTQRLRADGIAAAKAGERERARDLLHRVVQRDEGDLTAWLWLSGVVDDLDEREACLRSALALDLSNEPARRGLALVLKQQEFRRSTEIKAGLDHFADVPPPQPSSEAAVMLPDLPLAVPPPSILEEFSDEFLCPYCAAPTRPEDEKCPACGEGLMVKVWHRESRSVLMWILLALQALITLSAASALVGVMLVPVSSFEQASLAFPGLNPSVMGLLFKAFGVFWFLLSAGLLVGLYLRWKPVYYIYLANAVLGILSGFLVMLGLYRSPSGLLCGGGAWLMSVGWLMLVFQLRDDFSYEWRRVTLTPDPDVRTFGAFLGRGQEYARRKMWALAALHLQHAAIMAPDQVAGRPLLALMYLHLNRRDLAEKALAEARAIRPNDPRIAEVQAEMDAAEDEG